MFVENHNKSVKFAQHTTRNINRIIYTLSLNKTIDQFDDCFVDTCRSIQEAHIYIRAPRGHVYALLVQFATCLFSDCKYRVICPDCPRQAVDINEICKQS